MPLSLKELQDKREKLAHDMKELGNTQDKWTTEDRQKWDTLNNDYSANLTELENAVKEDEKARADKEAINKRLEEINSYKRYNPENSLPGRDGGSLADGPINLDQFQEYRDQHAQNRALAFQAWCLGPRNASMFTKKHHEAVRALNVDIAGNTFNVQLLPTDKFNRLQRDAWNVHKAGDPATGGALIGSTMVMAIEQAMLDYSGVMQFAEIIRTNTGEPYAWPTIDDTANQGTLVGESQDAGTATDMSFGKTVWHAFEYTSGVAKMSRTLIQDAPMDLEGLLGRLLGERMARKFNADATTGVGGGNIPKGIMQSTTLGVTAASATAIVFDEVIDLEHSIDPSRRNASSAGYSCHDTIMKHLRKLKTGDGQYLWSNGTQAGRPDLLNGRRIFINQNMASSMASGNKTLIFGELSMFKVRQVNGFVIQKLIERFAEYNQDAFVGYMRADAGLLDAGDHPVKHLVH